ncbi:nucleic acid-binding, OB-fold protein [Tanacetum coccineum]|uniref:Nucleic acid-binding, OB-fold protein n=1 Tax=Tanacetum coccineum TaxID=301880 RepID=A0ABQ5B429_9ASTR
MTFPGLSPHKLELKVGSPIMLLRNVNLSGGLCNRTRMIVRSLMSKLIEAQIITGMSIGEKVQFITMSAATIASLIIGQENCILEAKVYRRWISKSILEMKALAYCCILIDRGNNAIQATMDINNIDYFSQLLKPHAAYRISNFICERTKPYQQTLENQITLRFGKIIVFEPLPGKEFEFLDHQYELIPYHQLPLRFPYRDENSKLIYLILTDYLGCIWSISNIIPFGTPTTSQKYLRKVDIEDLDENIVEFTMWDDLSRQFDKREIEKLTPSITIAASSWRITKYKDTQLSATPATHYYINPQTPEAQHVYTTFKEKYNSNPPLQIAKYRCQDLEEEKIRNRQTLHTLLEQNPTTFKIHYALSTQQGVGSFIAYDVLDIQLAVQTEDAGTAVATSSATPSKETAGKEKHITGTILAISPDTTTIELTNKDKHTPGTPPHDLIEEVARTIVSTIPAKKADT